MWTSQHVLTESLSCDVAPLILGQATRQTWQSVCVLWGCWNDFSCCRLMNNIHIPAGTRYQTTVMTLGSTICIACMTYWQLCRACMHLQHPRVFLGRWQGQIVRPTFLLLTPAKHKYHRHCKLAGHGSCLDCHAYSTSQKAPSQFPMAKTKFWAESAYAPQAREKGHILHAVRWGLA